MEESEEFAAYCQKLIGDYASGMVDMTVAASRIDRYPLQESAHLMLQKVQWAAYDIGESYRSQEDDKENWDTIVKTIENYVSLNWEPTYWALALTYSEINNAKITHSYSAVVRRQNGVISITAPLEDIEKVIAKTILGLNKEQTDYWFLQNLTQALPNRIEPYLLTHAEVKEHLVVPDYSTAPGNN